jgi:hypothetical protein
MDLVQGQMIKITEIVDKDWYRGESNGKSGIFPSTFVRIIDSFPGDVPPASADLSSYLNAGKTARTAGDYMNTRNAFQGLEENLKVLGPPKMASSTKLAFFPRQESLLEEDPYFKTNLPPTYGIKQQQQQQQPSRGIIEVNTEETVLGLASESCTRGYENMVKSLGALKTAKEASEEEEENNPFKEMFRAKETKLVTPYR